MDGVVGQNGGQWVTITVMCASHGSRGHPLESDQELGSQERFVKIYMGAPHMLQVPPSADCVKCRQTAI